eukprot:767189-Hanusia_phi.AAC.2
MLALLTLAMLGAGAGAEVGAEGAGAGAGAGALGRSGGLSGQGRRCIAFCPLLAGPPVLAGEVQSSCAWSPWGKERPRRGWEVRTSERFRARRGLACRRQLSQSGEVSEPNVSNSAEDEIEQFVSVLAESVSNGHFAKCTLSKNKGDDKTLVNIYVRMVEVKKKSALQFLYRHKTNDIYKNYNLEECVENVRSLLRSSFKQAHLFTTEGDWEIMIGKSTKLKKTKTKTFEEPVSRQHDRTKNSMVSKQEQYLQLLGITNNQGQARPGMVWTNPKHVYMPSLLLEGGQTASDSELRLHPGEPAERLRHPAGFEVISMLYDSCNGRGLQTSSPGDDSATRPLTVLDMGCGKGYLTFAAHDYLTNKCGIKVRTKVKHHYPSCCLKGSSMKCSQGVEMRQELVDKTNEWARDLNMHPVGIQEEGRIEERTTGEGGEREGRSGREEIG